MVKIIEIEEIRADLPPIKIDSKDAKGFKPRYRKGELITTIEHLSCGHVNNLGKKDRVSGKCPKGCE